MTKKHAYLMQTIMTFIMAWLMSGLVSMIVVGPSLEWLASWPKQFIIAWPIAFVLTSIVRPLSMGITGKVLPIRTTPEP